MKFANNIRHMVLTFVIFVFLASGCSLAAASGKLPSTPAAVVAIQNTPTVTDGIGVLGDSMSDEYQADDARGGPYSKTTLNWVEQLAKTRGLNFGKWGTWDEPRRTGYEYNWARTGATFDSMITSGQHTGLAQQVAEGKVSVVVIWIGNNDFHLKNGPYEEIYSGKISDTDLQEKIDHYVDDLTTAVDTIQKAGKVKMGIVTVADQGLAPQARILFPDSEKRKRVTNAVNNLNARIKELADARGLIVLDSNTVGQTLFARVDFLGNLEVGDQKITVLVPGDGPNHLQLSDHIGHAGTVLSGIIANALFIQPFDDAFGLGISPLTDDEILQNAGLK